MWIITRTSRGTLQYRTRSGRLSVDPERAAPYQSASAALADAHEGDIIERRFATPLERHMPPPPPDDEQDAS